MTQVPSYRLFKEELEGGPKAMLDFVEIGEKFANEIKPSPSRDVKSALIGKNSNEDSITYIGKNIIYRIRSKSCIFQELYVSYRFFDYRHYYTSRVLPEKSGMFGTPGTYTFDAVPLPGVPWGFSEFPTWKLTISDVTKPDNLQTAKMELLSDFLITTDNSSRGTINSFCVDLPSIKKIA